MKPSWSGTLTSGDDERSLPFDLVAVSEIVHAIRSRLGHIDISVSRTVFVLNDLEGANGRNAGSITQAIPR
ncbi:MAG: hypothetical protein PHP20_04070 [Firmicutes bacterium]|nr:hypothetical protein [Bacillota bacterium]MDD4335879.1 hypothetical protein [Bacillota bacterium]MDD4792219.1 hypothetical protein [Bacillota bacterium]